MAIPRLAGHCTAAGAYEHTHAGRFAGDIAFWWQRLLSLASVGLILATFVLSLGLTTAGKVVNRLPELSLGLITIETGRIWGRITFWLGFAPSILLYYTIYRLLSDFRMRWWEWVPGAIWGGLSWGVGKQLFTHYVVSFRPYSLIYGTLGKFIAFIIWSYYTGVILLVGAELSVVARQVWTERQPDRVHVRQVLRSAFRRKAQERAAE